MGAYLAAVFVLGQLLALPYLVGIPGASCAWSASSRTFPKNALLPKRLFLCPFSRQRIENICHIGMSTHTYKEFLVFHKIR